MDAEYQCYYCHAVFPAEGAVDGFSRGYPTGFLCPSCGRNIRDNLFGARQRLDRCQRKWLAWGAALYIPVLVASLFDTALSIGGHKVPLDTLALAVYIATVLLILWWVPCTRKAGVFLTEPVDEP